MKVTVTGLFIMIAPSSIISFQRSHWVRPIYYKLLHIYSESSRESCAMNLRMLRRRPHVSGASRAGTLEFNNVK